MKLRLILNSSSTRPSRPPLAPAEPALRAGEATPRSSLRIWELEPDTVALVTGLLFSREELEELVESAGAFSPEGLREDALRIRLLLACSRPCAVARAVEAALDERTLEAAGPVATWPMIRIAEWWARECDRLAPADLAALLWRLATDPGPYLGPLALRVGGHLFARAARTARREGSPHRWPPRADLEAERAWPG